MTILNVNQQLESLNAIGNGEPLNSFSLDRSRCGCIHCRASQGRGGDDINPGWTGSETELNIERELSISSFPSSSGISSNTTWSGIPSSNDYVDGLMSNRKWGTGDPDSVSATNLLYYIYDNETLSYDYDNANGDDFGQSVSSDQEAAMVFAMAAFSDVSGLTFTETSTKSEANLAWAMLNNTDSGAGILGWAYYPGQDSNTDYGGGAGSLVTVNQSYLTSSARTTPGSYYFITFSHEPFHDRALKRRSDGDGARRNVIDRRRDLLCCASLAMA